MNYINKFFTLLIFFVCVLVSSKAFCDYNIEEHVDKNEISIGDNVTLDIKFTLPDKSVLIKPEYDCVKDWHVKNIKVIRDKKDHNTYTINIILTTFKPTVYEIPSIDFVFVDKNKNQGTISTKAIEINIVNTLAENILEIDSLKNVKNVKKLKIKTTYLYVFLIFVLYFVLLLVVYMIRRKEHIKLYNINKTKTKMMNTLEKLVLDKIDLKSKYLEIYKILISFIKIEYNIDSKSDIENIISQLADLDISSSTFRILSNILKKISDIKEYKIEIEEKDLNNHINNLKFVISNSIKTKE